MSVDPPKFASGSLSGYLSLPTRVSPHCRDTALARAPHACIIHGTQFLFEFQTANQPGLEPESPGPKRPTLTIELHSIVLQSIDSLRKKTFSLSHEKHVTCLHNAFRIMP